MFLSLRRRRWEALARVAPTPSPSPPADTIYSDVVGGVTTFFTMSYIFVAETILVF